MSKGPTKLPADVVLVEPNYKWHMLSEEGGIAAGIWINSVTKQWQSYRVGSGETPHDHPSFEAAYIALKIRS